MSSGSSSQEEQKLLLEPHVPLDVCDRRLSRAARSILEQQVLPLLRHHGAFTSSARRKEEKRTLAPLSLWRALQDTLQSSNGSCILEPTRDFYFESETNSLLRTQVGVPRQQLPYRSMNSLYECGICGKTFLTRYYLDLHMETKHNENSTESSKICPATVWCQFLGGDSACRVQALEDEPYYGRGSGGYGVDSIKIRREWTKQYASQQHQCRQEDMALSQQQCRTVMHECFSQPVATDLVHAVCDGLTCQDALHRLMGEAHRHVHSWKHEWNRNHRVNFGWSGTLVLVVLLGFYSCKVFSRLYQSHIRSRSINNTFGASKSTRKKQANLRIKLQEIRSKSKVQ